MAFGLRRRKRKRAEAREKVKQQEQERQKEIEESQKPGTIAKEYEDVQDEVTKLKQKEEERLKEKRARDEEDIRRILGSEMSGMSEEHKRALRESANQRINSQVSGYQRRLASMSGRQGIRGPAANAPQLELSRAGMEARNQFERDLTEQNELVAMQKLAALMAGLEGRTAEDILRNRDYIDWITSRQQQKRERERSSQYGQDYRRV